MRKFVVWMSFRQDISSIPKNLPQIDHEVVEKFEVFVVFDAIRVKFPRDFVISSNKINKERTNYELHFLKRTLQRFA